MADDISANSSPCSARTSSGSSVSESAVKPHRSANSTVTGRRSELVSLLGTAAAGANGLPHFGQNAKSAGASKPQPEQINAMCAASHAGARAPSRCCSRCRSAISRPATSVTISKPKAGFW